jgi:hypothetical protein
MRLIELLVKCLMHNKNVEHKSENTSDKSNLPASKFNRKVLLIFINSNNLSNYFFNNQTIKKIGSLKYYTVYIKY